MSATRAISRSIVTEDEDDVIQTRLRLVNPQTRSTGLDRAFNDTFNGTDKTAARVALRGLLADEMPHYDLDNQQDIVAAPRGWRSGG